MHTHTYAPHARTDLHTNADTELRRGHRQIHRTTHRHAEGYRDTVTKDPPIHMYRHTDRDRDTEEDTHTLGDTETHRNTQKHTDNDAERDTATHIAVSPSPNSKSAPNQNSDESSYELFSICNEEGGGGKGGGEGNVSDEDVKGTVDTVCVREKKGGNAEGGRAEEGGWGGGEQERDTDEKEDIGKRKRKRKRKSDGRKEKETYTLDSQRLGKLLLCRVLLLALFARVFIFRLASPT
eukprot:2863293-Rhodomonas_salina.1